MKLVMGCAASLAMLTAAPVVAQERHGLLERALSCQIGASEIATLMSKSQADDAGMKRPAQTLAAPSGNLYRLTKPVSALGYSTSEIYVAPGRFAMAISGQALASVSAKLQLAADPYGPAERRIDASRAIIAYQLHQAPLADKVLVGCAYDDPAALGWLGQDNGLF